MEIASGLISLLIYFYISKALGPPPQASLRGASSYFEFAAVGIAITLVVQAVASTVARRLREEQLTGTLEQLVGQPVTSLELALGTTAFPYLHALLRGVVYLGIAALLGADYSEADWAGALASLGVSGLALAPVGIALSGLVLLVKRAEQLGVVAVVLLALLGGAYFPISVFPGWLQPIAEGMPTRFVFDAVRSSLFTGEDWAGSALILVGFAIFLAPVATWLFHLALRRSRRTGSLAEY
jgi:ABC-2 type transport system permease protein